LKSHLTDNIEVASCIAVVHQEKKNEFQRLRMSTLVSLLFVINLWKNVKMELKIRDYTRFVRRVYL